jgi:hypothetical protein
VGTDLYLPAVSEPNGKRCCDAKEQAWRDVDASAFDAPTAPPSCLTGNAVSGESNLMASRRVSVAMHIQTMPSTTGLPVQKTVSGQDAAMLDPCAEQYDRFCRF